MAFALKIWINSFYENVTPSQNVTGVTARKIENLSKYAFTNYFQIFLLAISIAKNSKLKNGNKYIDKAYL